MYKMKRASDQFNFLCFWLTLSPKCLLHTLNKFEGWKLVLIEVKKDFNLKKMCVYDYSKIR